ncbi:MAG: PAS domain S-box protein [Methanolinea sp.]|jgi:PAS domain S-box-containing protein|nr:PAS domain S-box protein [Methanolinea sp.]
MISVLYIDDEPGLLEIGKIYLERKGEFAVDTAISGPEALQIIQLKRFEAIISDYQMPGMNGIELLKHIRASGNRIPFIIFTGRGREEVVIQALNEGADFYLQKGGEPGSQFAELIHKVRQAVQQRRAEESIRDHERREADILNFLPDATFAIDTEGRVIAWNRAIEKMTNVKAEDIVGKGDYEYAIPFYHERRPILIDLVLSEDPATAAKYPVIKREGNKIVSEITIPHFNEGRGAALWFTASPLYDTGGNVVGAIESIREITERKQVEEALNESERRFRDLSDLLPQVIYEADANGNVTYANRIAFAMFGYAEEDLQKGLNVLDLIAPDDRKRAGCMFLQLIEKGSRKQETREYGALRKDGSTFPVSIYSSPVLREGRIVGIRGIIIDITDQIQAEKRIRESEQNYRLLFETATEGILIAQGDRMVHINPALVKLLERPADVITSHPFTDFIHPDDREMVLDRHLQRMRGDIPPTGYMFRILTGSEQEKWVWINSTLITWSGKPATLSFLTDITEQKKAEEGLVSANKEYINLLNQIQDVYYRSDEQGRLIKASQSWATLLGYDDPTECLGRSIADDFYVNPPDRKKLIEEIYRDGKVTNYEVLLKKKDGSPVLVETSSHLYRDPAGNILGIEGTFRDITERKQQESILRNQLTLGLELQQIHEMHEALEACLDAAIEISGMDSGGFYLVDEESGSLDLILSQNLGDAFVESVSHYPPDSANARMVKAGKPLFSHFNDLGIANSPAQQQEALRAVAILPITSNGRSIAFMNLSSHTVSDISPNARVALETIATQIGAAIERIRADKVLAESEQRYRNVVEDQTEFISRFLPDGTHVFVNDAYCRYFGLRREEIMGHSFRPKIPKDDRERVKRFFESLTPDNPVGSIQHRILMPDGKTRWQRWSDRGIFDPSGTLIEYQSVGRDITDIKEVEEELREKESWYLNLTEGSPDIIFMIDRNDRITYVNRAAAATMGVDPNDIIGRERGGLFPEDISMQQRKAIGKVIETGEQLRSSGKLSFGGSLHWFDHSLVPVWDSSGNITHVLGISRDITEQKRGEVALRTRTEELDNRNRIIITLLDTIPVGIFMVEAPSGKPIIANREAARLLGRGVLPDATEENLADVYRAYQAGPCTPYPPDQMPIIRGMKGEASYVDDMVVVRPDGTRVMLEVFGTPVTDRENRVIASLVSFLDITNRKQEEEVLKEKNKKINLLASITRHDVANQVSILRGYATIAMMHNPDPTVRDLLSKIDSAGSTITQQIEFIKAYEKLGLHAPGWYNVSDIIAQFNPEDITLTCNCKDIEVCADPMLEKVFFNLIDNAARHGEKVTAISVLCEEDHDGLSILVEDDGIGIPPDRKARIFEKGYGKNTGFGLFLAREILAMTGITIRETGVPGKGARFELRVPGENYRRHP